MVPCRGFVHRRCPLKRFIAAASLVVFAVAALPATEAVDLDMVTKIRLEEFTNSKAMETASELMDRVGPRLTGSPQMKAANEWTKTEARRVGPGQRPPGELGAVRPGLDLTKACSVRMIAPRARRSSLAMPGGLDARHERARCAPGRSAAERQDRRRSSRS